MGPSVQGFKDLIELGGKIFLVTIEIVDPQSRSAL
jgi:hypothetical protein